MRENEPIYRFNRLHSPLLTHSRRPGAAHIELHHHEIKLFQVQSLIGGDHNFRAIPPLEFFDTRLLLFL